MTVHDFKTSLALSHEQSDAPWWDDVYRAAFGNTFVSSVCVRKDGYAQRGGIDRILTLNTGRTIFVDEKVRAKNWNDILLERWSDVRRQKPGWVQKPLACDYIAYAFVQSETCYLLPTLTLQRAWRIHGRHWIRCYGTISAKNQGYITEFVPVPIPMLLDALGDAMTVNWGQP